MNECITLLVVTINKKETSHIQYPNTSNNKSKIVVVAVVVVAVTAISN